MTRPITSAAELVVGEHYTAYNVPGKLTYLGPSESPGWLQFAREDTPDIVWWELLEAILSNYNLEPVGRVSAGEEPTFLPMEIEILD